MIFQRPLTLPMALGFRMAAILTASRDACAWAFPQFLFRNIFRSNLSLAALNWSLPPSPVAVSSNATLQISGTHPATNSKSTRSRTTFPASSRRGQSHTRKMIDQSVSGRSSTHCHGQPWVRLDVLELDARRHVFVEQLLQEIAALGAQRLGELNRILSNHLEYLHEIRREEGHAPVSEHIESHAASPDVRGLAADVALRARLGCRERRRASSLVYHVVSIFHIPGRQSEHKRESVGAACCARACVRAGAVGHILRGAEVGEFQLPAAGQQKVLRLDISVGSGQFSHTGLASSSSLGLSMQTMTASEWVRDLWMRFFECMYSTPTMRSLPPHIFVSLRDGLRWPPRSGE